ncbi:hypothetical protein [Bacteroides sp.]|uniref:hypothetical protein n=1 Tax=Bacteroides sp. TaxID=29523 RepID=UPI002633E9FF|nr:hypothetical protein [Bacteroides sp.]MDD3040029.1 hypothetical protein [Bacteroides sp.]
MNWFFGLCWVLGVLVGYGLRDIMVKMFTSGTLRIDQSDPSEPPYMFLEGTIPIDWIIKKKRITFNVSVKDFIPRD